MRRASLAAAALALAAAAFPAPAFAAKGKTEMASDPEREICKSRPVIGSRLKRIRTCMTAQQWEELKLQEQLGLARQQFNGAPACDGACAMPRGGKDTPW